MKIPIILTLILLSCTESSSEPKDAVLNESRKTENFNYEVDLDSALEEEEQEIFVSIEKYTETGNPDHLRKVLDYYEKGLQHECIETAMPLYCGLVTELMGDKAKAENYYRQCEALALKRISDPLDCMEYENGATSEEEFIFMSKMVDSDFDINDFKLKKATVQKYYLTISQIALHQDKFKEVQALKWEEVDFGYLFFEFEIYKRVDIFKLIIGSVK